MRKKLKTTLLSGLKVEFWCVSGNASQFMWPRRGDYHAMPFIDIGMDQTWTDVVQGLLHEVEEFVAGQLECTWRHSFQVADDDSTRRMFLLTHADFSELIARTADTVVDLLPGLARVHRAWHRKKKQRHRAKKI